MTSQKDLGNEEFKQKNYEKAIEHYTKAIEDNPVDHTIYGNRSASYHNLKNYDKALEDAEKCIQILPSWGKGFQRKGMALHGLKRWEDAMEALAKAAELDPTNAQIKTAMDNLRRDFQSSQQGAGGLGGLFGGPEAMNKLKKNPKIAKYFEDPQFNMMWQMCQQNPQMMMQIMQTDPRFMDVFKELTGIDLGEVQEQELKRKDEFEDLKKKRMEEQKKKQEEDERKKKEEEENSLPQEEKLKKQQLKEAEALKEEGNKFYKQKNFESALSYYQQAIDKYPSELTFYSNKAACYFEMKQFDKCIEECDIAINIAKQGSYDYVKLSKAISRKANALLQLDRLDESIQTYEQALLETQDWNIKEALKKAKQIKKQKEAQAYLDPEKAEEHRQKGNELYKNGQFPAALKEYDEGLRRDPKSVAIYSNRCATYIKLMEFNSALKDADMCIELDPKFIKAFARKGTCHHFMKEYNKALKSFDEGLKIDPDNKDCKEGRQKTIMTIQMTAGVDSGNDEERLRHAMADPEIQNLMRNPTIIQVLKDLSTNPQGAMGALKDPFIADSINKLVAAGVVKMG